MSEDKMRAEFEKWAKAVGHDLSQTKGDDRYWFVSTESAWESWQAAYQAGQKAEREAIFIEWEDGEILASEVERLRAELELSKANAESLKKALHEVQNAAIRLGDQVDDAKTELAAAKAASVCPVKWKSVERFFKPFLSDADLGNKWGIEFWFDTKKKRDKFGKWVKERGEQ